ncbi:MAG: DUF2892 domain-containing protein [Deltaproteobacteria bacterium]
MFPATTKRVMQNTRPEINQRIAKQTEARLAKLPPTTPVNVINVRLKQLDREWDIERVLETTAAALAFVGILLALARSWYWLLLPLAVTGLLFLHALQGWCPPVPLLRRLGVRTETEINEERVALKVLRKDFEDLPKADVDGQTQALEILTAVRK